MSLTHFDTINSQLKDFTKELAYHVVGDPLVLSNLKEYLNISYNHGLKVNITTTANNINSSHHEILMHETIRQINFSINSYNANSHKKSFDDYINPIIDFVKYAQNQDHEYFINFRIWNLDEELSAKQFNKQVFEKINEEFKTNINVDDVYTNRPKNIRIAKKFFFHFDEYFNWPSLDNDEISKKGTCYGLDSHFGILSNGDVVPCCLDQNGCINLGNTNNSQLVDILNSTRVKDIQNGFKSNFLVEELCRKCEYRNRFSLTQGNIN